MRSSQILTGQQAEDAAGHGLERYSNIRDRPLPA